jgi:hypothetical protein
MEQGLSSLASVNSFDTEPSIARVCPTFYMRRNFEILIKMVE